MELVARALLFDMDGTLLDSFASANRAWDSWAETVGVETPVLRAGTHGTQRPGVVRIVLPGISEEDVQRHAETVRQSELHDVEGVTALPGSFDLITSLPTDAWAVVTSCDRAVAEARLNAAGIPIPKVLVSADDLSHGKPDPEGFLLAASRLGVEPKDAIVFEDATSGLEAAKRAGMRSVASRFTAEHDDELSNALIVINNPAAVTVVSEDGELKLSISEDK